MYAKIYKKNCLFLTKGKHKDEHKTIFKHRYLHALAKSATKTLFVAVIKCGRIYAPSNGVMSCTNANNYNSVCEISCLDGMLGYCFIFFACLFKVVCLRN